jgi:curved DNA-binding protein CbpA
LRSTATEPDPYSVLGVSRTATDAEVRAAYRALVARYHPDKYSGNPLEDLAAEKMAGINRAYEILSDPGRRAAYDGGASSFRAATGAGGAPGFGVGPRKNSAFVKIVALFLALPLLIRFGRFLVQALVALVRLAAEGTGWLRGTPFGAGLVLLAAVLLVIALVRRRSKKRRKMDSAPPSEKL